MYALTPTVPLGPFVVGDATVEVTLEVDDDGQPVNLATQWPDTDMATLIAPDYTIDYPVAQLGLAPDEVQVLLAQDWDAPGIYLLSVQLVNAAMGLDVTTESLAVVVEAQDGWLDLARTRALWPDARTVNDQALWLVLESAKVACLAYAPKLPEPVSPAVVVPIPANYLEAQLAQARAIWNLMQTAPQADVIGIDQLTIRVYPLDHNIRQLLRPKRGVPVVH